MVTAIELPPTKDPAVETIPQEKDDSSAIVLPAQSDSSSDEEGTPKKVSRVTKDDSKAKDDVLARPSSRGRTMPSLFDVDEEEESASGNKKGDGEEAPRQLHRSTASFDIDTSPTKKRCLGLGRSSSTEQTYAWDGFVRKGTRLKGLLDDALHLVVATGVQKEQAEESTETRVEESTTTAAPKSHSHEHIADIAREKTAECMILQKKLNEAEAHAATMTAANASLREAASASAERMERTMEALRIAGTNAANARADADAAEACAASMASQLQALRDVVDETKRASQVLYKEHEQVSAAARSIEAKLLQRETELARSQKDQRHWMEEREEMKKKAAKLEEERKALEKEMNELSEDLNNMKRQEEEYQALELARKDRSAMVEKELRDARGMLVEATASTAEAESTAAVLKETIDGLETENKTLHEKIATMQDKEREESERLNDALTKAEKEAQTLRVKAATHEEDIQRFRMDRTASEKQVSQLKTKVTTLERRLKEATTFTVSPAAESFGDSQGESRRGVTFSVPPLTANTPAKKNKDHHGAKENKANRVTPSAPKSTTCCICSQLASGFMKSCQCGKPTCDKRAHATCLANSKLAPPSVSHPGTPALRAPVLLCGTSSRKK